jgi:hypothetical protein
MPLSATWIGVIINLCGNVVINISHNSVKYGQWQFSIRAWLQPTGNWGQGNITAWDRIV